MTVCPQPLVFVLVHGAFHGGWCWRRVVKILGDAGARVFAPTMTGLGERAHLLTPTLGFQTCVDDVVGVIETEELSDIILVGHSFGGAVISGVADRTPERIRHLVYLDAVIPESGQSAISVLPPDTAAARLSAAAASPGGLTIPTPPAAAFDIPEGPDRDWAQRRITPQPLAYYTDPIPLRAPAGNGRPRTYIRCTDPVYAAVRPSYQRIAADDGWAKIDLATGHDAMITAPTPLSDLLLRLAQP